MRNTILFTTLVCVSTLMGAQTQTTFKMIDEKYVGQNTKGEALYEYDVSIETKNYKIDTFWSRFSWDSEGAKEQKFGSIATKAKVQAKVSSVYTCEESGLDAQGCSGQKPFLINEGVLENTDMQLKADGSQLPAGEYRIPFDSATNYSTVNDDAFYALDVYRDGKYYSEGNVEDASAQKPKSFLGYIIALFQDYFSKNVNIYELGRIAKEQRNRYIANITFGHQQNYLVEKNSPIITNDTNKADATKKVSLLDYDMTQVVETTGCETLLFSFNPESMSCKFINFFGLSNFMPFVNSDPTVQVEANSVVEDTETTLLVLQSKLDNEPYLENRTQIDEDTDKRTLKSEFFKPVSFMASSMFRFFFGSESKNITEMVSAEWSFTNPMPLTFIMTDGTKATGFEYFELLGLESVYGTEVESCKVKERSFFGLLSTNTVFTKGVQSNTKFDMDGLWSWAKNLDYSELNVTTEEHGFFFKHTHEIVNVSTDDWLDWCKRNQGRQQKGLIGRILDWAAKLDEVANSLLGNSKNGQIYDEQLDALLRSEDFEVVEYKEKVHKGLILHLRHLDTLEPEAKGTTTQYKFLDMQRGL